MTLCFIEPQNAIRVIADSVGREARRQILGEVVRAWVDEIPESDLDSHYAKAVADLDEHDCRCWPRGTPRSRSGIRCPTRSSSSTCSRPRVRTAARR